MLKIPKHEIDKYCTNIEIYARSRGFHNIRCFLIKDYKTRRKEYRICNEDSWIFKSTDPNTVALHINTMKAKKDEENDGD